MRKFILIVIILLVLFLIFPISIFAESNSRIDKTQTVYSVLGWDGEIKSTSVVNWLRFLNDNKKVIDNPELKNIVSLHSNAKMKIIDDSVEWELPIGTGNDLFYSGITNKELPIKFDIDLLLDGNETNAFDVIGKSGTLEINLSFVNTLAHEEIISWKTGDIQNSKSETIYTPMTVIVQADIPSDDYDELIFENAFEMTIGNSRKLMWTVMPRPKEVVSFSITDDILQLPAISISIMPTLPSIQIPEIDDSLIEIMSSMGDSEELLDMLDKPNMLDLSSSISNIENLENMFSAIDGLMDEATKSSDEIGLLFGNYGESFKQIAEGVDGLVKLSEGHKMILEMIQEQLSENMSGIIASSGAIEKASIATEKVSSSLFGIQFYLEEMETTVKDLRKKTKDSDQLELISELESSVSKSLSKLSTVKSNADIASEFLEKLSNGGVIDGVTIPALSEMPEMMELFDQTLSALISGGEIQDQELPGLNTTIEGLNGISDGVNLIINGGVIEGNEVPSWESIPKLINESMSSLDVFRNDGEINGVTIPSQKDIQNMIDSFKKTLEETEPIQKKLDEFTKNIKDAIDNAGGLENFTDVIEDTEEMFYVETAKLDRMKDFEKEYTSFVGSTPDSNSTVLFVIKLEDAAKIKESISDGFDSKPNDPNPFKELNKARIYLLIIAFIIVIVAILVNWYFVKRYNK